MPGVALLALAACGEAEGQRGSLMLAISTDMYVDKDLSRVDIVVQPERGPLQSTQVNLFPELDGQFLPGTFSIIEGSEPGEFVRVRIIARQNERVRVVREAALRVPRQRTALLSMPIQWLCDGQVRQDGQLHRSDCQEDYTCISGTCQPDEVEEATLPDYVSADVFGGGAPSGGGECFDTLPCFEESWEPPLDLATCRLGAALDGDLNVAVVLPSGGDGHCTESSCWIPLDQSELTGWFAVDGGASIQLPMAICDHVRADTAKVRASTLCAPKSPSTPTCGPWSLIGGEPGGGPGDLPGGPLGAAFAAADARLVSDLSRASGELAAQVATACASLASSTAPRAPSASDVEGACDLALSALAGQLPIVWYQTPSECRTDYALQAACESDCDAQCEPAPLEQRCEANQLSGRCEGACGSRSCLSAGSTATVSCTGFCSGRSNGTCEGQCLGQCLGDCSAPSPDGYCDGTCTGTCDGQCQGRTSGTCEGLCNGDLSEPAASCGGEALCMGGCDGTYTAAACWTPLATSGCEPGCEGICGAVARVNSACSRPSVWVMPGPVLLATTQAQLTETLPELVLSRDARASLLLDEATRLLERIDTSPGASAEQRAEVEAAVELLQAIVASTTEIMSAVGPARGGIGFIGGPPVFTCDSLAATGEAPLIDDFEDGDTLVLPNDGRSGGWHVIQDGSGQLAGATPLAPVSGGANQTSRSLGLSGSGFQQWGAGLSVDFRQSSNRYDASVHQGLRFFARGSGSLRVVFLQGSLAMGHPCSVCGAETPDCGQFYASEVFLSDLWNEFFIPWDLLSRNYEGGTPFSAADLLSVQFEAPGPAFEFQLDEVSFY